MKIINKILEAPLINNKNIRVVGGGYRETRHTPTYL